MDLPAIKGRIELDQSPSLRAYQDVEKESGKFKNIVEKDAQQAANTVSRSFKASLTDVKAEFGKGSALGQGLKLLAGGGAIAGIGMAVHEAEAVTEGIAKLANEYRKGETSGRDMAAEFVREVPILGGMIKVVDNLREAWTGEGAALDAQNEALQRQTLSQKALAKAMEEGSRAVKEQSEWLLRLQGIAAEMKGSDADARFNVMNAEARAHMPNSDARDAAVRADRDAQAERRSAQAEFDAKQQDLKDANAYARSHVVGEGTADDPSVVAALADDAAKALDKANADAADARNAALVQEKKFNDAMALNLQARRVLEDNFIAGEEKINAEAAAKDAEALQKKAESQAKVFRENVKGFEGWVEKGTRWLVDVMGKADSRGVYSSGVEGIERFGSRTVTQADLAPVGEKTARNTERSADTLDKILTALNLSSRDRPVLRVMNIP